jgi:Membrane GTPase LepA
LGGVVDASQGVEAQRVANSYRAIEEGKEIIPEVNKNDLPAAEPEKVLNEVEEIIGDEVEETALISAKTGEGIEYLMEKKVKSIPSPKIEEEKPLQALIIDWRLRKKVGVVRLKRIFEGKISVGEKNKVMSTGQESIVKEMGVYTPKKKERKTSTSGEVGNSMAGVKEMHGAPVGETVTHPKNPTTE